MIFYYFIVEFLIFLFVMNKKFLVGKKKNLKRFFYIFLFVLNCIFWKIFINKLFNFYYKVKIMKNNKIEKVFERILVLNISRLGK